MDDSHMLITLALKEDLGTQGDVTSQALFQDETSKAVLISKQTGVLAGVKAFLQTYAQVDPEVAVTFLVDEGALLAPGDRVAELSGKVLSLLEGERTALNFLSFLSGIATQTRAFTQAAGQEPRVLILDTRKTLPGYRRLSKEAVLAGGGHNHRQGLYDRVMIKDNHIDAAGSLLQAVKRVREKWGKRFIIEVETRNLEETAQAAAAGVDVIMLDNMSAEETAQAAALGDGKVLFEASGNMTLEKIPAYAATGVDYISVGALTHSVSTFDFSLRMVKDA